MILFVLNNKTLTLGPSEVCACGEVNVTYNKKSAHTVSSTEMFVGKQ